VARWRPGHTSSLICSMQHSRSSATSESAAWHGASASRQGRPSSSRTQMRPATQQHQQRVLHCDAATAAACHAADVVPGWIVGADPLHGTFKVVQPFGDGTSNSTAAAARQGIAATQRPGSSGRGGRCSPARKRPSSAPRRPASAGPCCGSSSSSRTGGVAVVSPAAMKVVGCRWGAGGAASVLGSPGGSGSCISSQWLCTGVEAEELGCQQAQAWQQQQRPRSAAAAARQRPASASGHVASSSNSCLNTQPDWSANQRASRPGSAAAAGTSPVPRMPARAGGNAGSLGVPHGSNISRSLERPSSCPPHSVSSSVGLAEKRRLAESMRQDLTAVRLLQ
jgi:hypothetical protein